MNASDPVVATDVLEIDPKYLFRWEEPQKAHVLLYPEGVVKLNETGAAILALCDGTRSTEQIINELSDKYATDVAEGVHKFLEVSHAKGWVRYKS